MGAAFGSTSANALHVLGDLTGSPDRLREARGFVAWPPPGYVPAATVFRRWSFRLFGEFDFSAASVAVVGDSGPVRIEVVHRGEAASYRPRPALVWEVAEILAQGAVPEPTGGDECYTVTISGVRAGGVTQSPYGYETCVLDLGGGSPDAGGPLGPQGLEPVDIAHDSVTLSWAMADQPAGVTVRSYIVERLDGVDWIGLHSSPSALTRYTVRGLRPSTEYSFRVRLDTTAGDASATATVRTATAPTGVPVSGHSADDTAGEVEVRIVARRAESGRVEFGLQQRERGGDWGGRLLPRQRFFPPDARVGRWLVSTPVALSTAAATGTGLPPGFDTTTTTTTTTTTQPTVDPYEELASRVLAGANFWRGSLTPLALDEELSAAALARARAQARNGDWQNDFDYGPLLMSDWEFWFSGNSAYIGRDLDDVAAARRLSDLLLDEDGFEALRCAPCTRLGVGAATAGGRTYATVLVAGPPPTEAEIAAVEREMAGLVNRLRASLGLRELVWDGGIAAVARRWSQRMAADGRLYHNPGYFEQYPGRPEFGAENGSHTDLRTSGGVGSLSAAIGRSFDGLVDSPDHYVNIVNPDLTHRGVGIVVDGTEVWITQNFARYRAAPPPEPPGPTTVTATGGDNRLSARWSAEANCDPITTWEFRGNVTGSFAGSVTSHTWTGIDPGRYTFEVRACNSRGCGAWGAAAATVTDPAAGSPATSPSVRLTRGRNAQGLDSGCAGSNCHFLRVELVDFQPGRYTVHCWHYAVSSAGWGHADWLSDTTSSTVSEHCIWGVPGHAVYVIVEDLATGETVQSNDAQWP